MPPLPPDIPDDPSDPDPTLGQQERTIEEIEDEPRVDDEE
jgi:hypothetical protein